MKTRVWDNVAMYKWLKTKLVHPSSALGTPQPWEFLGSMGVSGKKKETPDKAYTHCDQAIEEPGIVEPKLNLGQNQS